MIQSEVLVHEEVGYLAVPCGHVSEPRARFIFLGRCYCGSLRDISRASQDVSSIRVSATRQAACPAN